MSRLSPHKPVIALALAALVTLSACSDEPVAMNAAAETKFFNEIEDREKRQRDELVLESEAREQIVEDASEERLERAETAQ